MAGTKHRGSGRGAYMKAVAAKKELKKKQQTEGTVERADYLNSKKGLFIETMKGVGKKIDKVTGAPARFMKAVEQVELRRKLIDSKGGVTKTPRRRRAR